MADNLNLIKRVCISTAKNRDDDDIQYCDSYRHNEQSYWSSSIPLSELRRFATDSSLYHRHSSSSLYSHDRNEKTCSTEEGVEEEPIGWSCPVMNDAYVIHRPPLCLYRPVMSNSNSDPALIVANRPISLLIHPATVFGAHQQFHKLYPTFPKTENPWESPNYYYFEVTLLCGNFFIGFISTKNFLTNDTNIPDKGTPTSGQLCEENNTHNFPITSDAFPGKAIHSIGLETNEGNLYIHGKKIPCYYSNALSSIKPGDIIGAGLERDYTNSERHRRVFFTRNGEVIYPNNQGNDDFPIFLKHSDSVASVLPSVGVMGGSKILGNFRKETFCFSPQPQACKTKHHLHSEKKSFTDFSAKDSRNTNAALLENPKHQGTLISKEEENAIERAKQLSLENTSSSSTMVEYNNAIDDYRSGSDAKGISPTSKELEDIDFYSKQLRRYLHDLEAHDGKYKDEVLFQNLIDVCRGSRKKVASAIQTLTEINNEREEDTLSTLLAANAELNDVLEEADKMVDLHAAGTVEREVSASNDSEKQTGKADDLVKEICYSSKFYVANYKVPELTEKKDIFNLICLLRSGARKEAAKALLQLVKNEANIPADDAIKLQNEIISLGGMHSLLTLFRSCCGNNNNYDLELQKVAALAVSFLIPSYYGESCDIDAVSNCSSEIKMDYELRLLECLKFLIVDIKDTDAETRKCAAVALTHRWINVIEPYLHHAASINDGNSDTWSGRNFGKKNYRQLLQIHQVTRQAVALLLALADMEVFDCIPLMDFMCTIEPIQLILAQDGVIEILVRWIRSKTDEFVSSASNALKELTSSGNLYMAGWIHSQLIYEGAIPALIEITPLFQREVRLSAAEILSNLTVAPLARDAIVKAGGPAFLVHLLTSEIQHIPNDSWDETVAVAAGTALLRLITVLPTQLSNAVIDQSADTRNDESRHLISKIVRDGVLEPLVTITVSRPHEKARSVAVGLLRLICDGARHDEWTWEQLCRAGAARALAGNILKEAVKYLTIDGRTLNFDCSFLFESAVQEMTNALQCLTSLLEPFPENENSESLCSEHSYNLSTGVFKECLMLTSNETATSGGVHSLLSIAALSLQAVQNAEGPSVKGAISVDLNCLLLESYRALSSMCHHLLSPSSADPSLASLTILILPQLSKALFLSRPDRSMSDIIEELQVASLRGLRSFSKFFPIKTTFIETCLPQLFQLKNSRNGVSAAVSQYATQLCLDLPLSAQDMEAVGNDVRSWAIWFHLERSMLLQAFAKHEIRAALLQIWKHELSAQLTIDKGLVHSLDDSLSSSEKANPYSSMNEGIRLLQNFFPNISEDALIPFEFRAAIVRQYSSISDCWADSSPHQKEVNSSIEKCIQWVLFHKRAIEADKKGTLLDTDCVISTCVSLSRRVQEVLDIHFPSSLIQSEVVPLFDLQQTATFDFVGLDMPQQNYFSFRREGQVIQRMCEEISSRIDPTSRFWTLGFTNSSFGGEFAETLIQTLYRCRFIRSISFATITESCYDNVAVVGGEDMSQTLHLLLTRLPPWVTYLTFDNFQSHCSLLELLDAVINPAFEALAIRNSGNKWLTNVAPFIDRIHRGGFISLRLLDLSGNNLGDEICGKLLASVLDESSECILERLDLSGNSIGKGEFFTSALEVYASRVQRTSNRLKMLKLNSNSLHLGNVFPLIISMLDKDCFKLSSLSLANNGLTGDEQGAHDIFSYSLSTNTRLIELDLSYNNFRCSFFSHLLNGNPKGGLGFINLIGNDPPVHDGVLSSLQSFLNRGRHNQISKRRFDRESNKRDPWMQSVTGDKSVAAATPRLTLAPSENAALVDRWNRETKNTQQGGKWTSRTSDSNKLTVFFSAPLGFVIKDSFKPVEADLNFQGERELLFQSFREARMDIDLTFDTATTDRLIAARSRRCSCIHYSGHGYPKHLAFENGMGGVHWLSVDQLKSVISNGNGGEAPFNFVFVSACYSLNIGQTFVEAGVPHVVCCNQNVQLMDCAALAFTRQFYLALAYGLTVKDAFELGRQAVAVSPGVPNSEEEMRKFVLLPSDGNHDQPVFHATRVDHWPVNGATDAVSLFVGKRDGLPKITEQPLPSLPLGFLGREFEMYRILQDLISKRCVALIGEPGIGLTSLASAVCHYISDRKSTLSHFEVFFFVQPQETRGLTRISSLINQLCNKLSAAGMLENIKRGSDFDDTIGCIKLALSNVKALIVLDGVDILDTLEDAQELPLFLGSLFQHTPVKVLLTAQKPFGRMSFAGVGPHPIHVGPLTMKSTIKLFLFLCPHVHTDNERRFMLQNLCPLNESLLRYDDAGMSDRSKDLLALMGYGNPSRIFDIAFSIEKVEFENLLSKFDNKAKENVDESPQPRSCYKF